MNELSQNIYWVGFIDWDLRTFHGYSTPKGSTYNAYLIIDDEPTLIDTVKHYGFQEMLRRIRQVIDPGKIKYIVSNHTEMDHSGSIDELLAYCPNATVVCSPKGQEGLKKHFKKNWNFKVVQNGDSLTIGKRTLQFYLMPMVHWPDSMATYLREQRILFPNDAFGQHYASNVRFADETGIDIILEEAAKYYANIVLPYGTQVNKALAQLQSLIIEMICPSHGTLWRRNEDILRIVSLYKRWADHIADNRVIIIYDTMWHSTEQIARRLFELIDSEHIPVGLFNAHITPIADIMLEVMRSKIVLMGSPILNNQILPTISGLLTYMRGLKPRNRYGTTFGSYGWSPAGFSQLENGLKESGVELLSEGTYFQFIPDDTEMEKLTPVIEKIKAILQISQGSLTKGKS